MKIKWEASPVPTGKYRGFSTRVWPSASFENGAYAATLSCADEYVPAKVKSGDHSEIIIRVALHGVNPPESGLKTATLKRRAATLKEAKQIVVDFYNAKPQYVPK